MAAELWPHIKDLDWSMIGSDRQMSSWPSRMWPMDKHYSHIGSSGGYGVGYDSPAAVGAALANRDLGRFSVNIQTDGDMMYVPGVLWTAARHKIPMLTVMHNNRGYHQEVMHVQRMSNRRNRVAYLGNDLGPIGTRIENPDIDYAKLAAVDGLVGGRADHRSEGLERHVQEGGRGGEVGPAGAGRRGDAAALSTRDGKDEYVRSSSRAGGARRRPGARPGAALAAGSPDKGKAALHQVRLLPVPRLRGAGLGRRPRTAR